MVERQERLREREKLVSTLPAMEVKVPGLQELKEGCGRNQYQLGLLLMLQATITPALTTPERHKLMEVQLHTELLQNAAVKAKD